MISLGQFNHLKILRIVQPGAILGDIEGNEVLLPRRYIPGGAKKGDQIRNLLKAHITAAEYPLQTTQATMFDKNP